MGFGPTASCANGALLNEPSMLCHVQAMPDISSYSISPARQSVSKKPAACQRKKCRWMALALPNCSLGNAFHWMPVRKTKTIQAKTCRGGNGFRPAPGFRAYSRCGSRCGAGISGSTFCQNASETCHDGVLRFRFMA